MAKRVIKGAHFIEDIRAGMSDHELMNKYGLSPDELTTIFDQVVRRGKISREEIEGRCILEWPIEFNEEKKTKERDEGGTIAQRQIDERSLTMGSPPQQSKISPRIPLFLVTCLLCSIFFGWPFLLKQKLLVEEGWCMFYWPGQGIYAWGEIIEYLAILIALAALTVVPPILVWLWTPLFSIRRELSRRFGDSRKNQ
jgi:hypothetical protein